MISDSLERIVPDLIDERNATNQQSLRLHLERYRLASKYAQPGRLLDLACGVGYGAKLLITENNSVNEIVGVDIDSESINYAIERYAHPNIKYLQADALEFDDPAGFNTIVCLETIEHIKNPGALISRFQKLLLPGGRLIISAPVTPSTDANPFHEHDFSEKCFRRLFPTDTWKEITNKIQIQPFSLKYLFQKKKSKSLRKNIIFHYMKNPGLFISRVRSLIKYGFKNRYLVLVLEKK